MARYEAVKFQTGVVYIYDMKPKKSWLDKVCTIYTASSALSPAEVANALNLAYELGQLPAKSTKAQMQEIINRYKN